MKSKKSIYILLPVVLIIWGSVVYEFFSFTGSDDIMVPNQITTIKEFKIKPKDTFSIKISKRDPFFGKLAADNVASASNKHLNKKNSTITPELVWPEVKYKGIVSDNKEKNKVFMVLIDGKTYLMKKSEKQNGIKLKDGDRQTIYVEYKGDLKVIFIH